MLGQTEEVVKPLVKSAYETGFIAVLLTAIILFIGFLAWYAFKRCFGEKGMLTLFIADVRESTKVNTETLAGLRETTKGLQETTKHQVSNCDTHGKLLTQITVGTKKLIELHKDPSSVFATKETNEKVEVVRTDVKALKAAVYDSVEVVRSAAGDFDDKITQNILLTCCDRIETRLRAGVE